MALNGIITAERIKDKLFQEQVILSILQDSRGYGSLQHSSLITRMTTDKTYVSIPAASAVVVTTDLGELETKKVESPDFSSINVNLKADEIRVAISDETGMNSDVDLNSLITNDAASGFAYTLDKKIATALDTTPQVGTDWDYDAKSFLIPVAEAVGKLKPYKLTGIACGAETYGKIMASVYSGSNTQISGMYIQDGLAHLPGYNVPIVVSTTLDEIDSDAIYFVSNQAPGAILLENNHPKTRVYDDPDTRSTVLQADHWNALVSNRRQTDGNQNKGVVETTIV